MFVGNQSLQSAVTQTVHINSGVLTTPDTLSFPYLAFNETDTFSSENAIIELMVGDTLNLTVVNNDAEQHNFQVKGMTVSSDAIMPADSATYQLVFSAMGIYIYYDGLTEPDNRYLGLAGMIKVDDFTGNQSAWTLKVHQSDWNTTLAGGGSVNYPDFEPDYFTINGLSFPNVQSNETATITGNVGDTIRIYIANAGLMDHAIHFHGFHPRLVYSSEFPMHVNREKDTFPVKSMESVILELIPNKPGLYPVHDHNVVAVTGGGEYPNGMLVVMSID